MDLPGLFQGTPQSIIFLVSTALGILAIITLVWVAIVFLIRARRSETDRW